MDGKKVLPKLVHISIIAFWVLMMGILFFREVISRNTIAAYRPFLSKNTLLADQWMGIYFNQSLVGYTHSTIEPYSVKKGQSGYRILNRTFMNFLLLRKRSRVWFDADAFINENYQMDSFDFSLNSGVHRLGVSGKVVDKKVIDLEIQSQGDKVKRRIFLPPQKDVIVASILSPFSSFGELKVGARYRMKVFNPLSLELEDLEIEVTSKEVINFNQQTEEVFVVQSVYRGLVQTAWVNMQGEILKEETPLGWVLRKEDANIANRVYDETEKSEIELTDLISIRSNIELKPDKLSYLEVALRGLDDEFTLENQRQKLIGAFAPGNKKVIALNLVVVDKQSLLALPINAYPEFQQPSDFIQSDNSQIKEMAHKIIGDEKNSFLAARLLNKWVYDNIRKVPVISVPSALDVLKTREGDCNEHTALFVALARSSSIPAKINVGLVYTEGRFYYHAWPSVFVGRWIEMDPTFGQDIADVTHIKLLEGDLNRQLDIVRLLGKIKLEVMAYR